MVKQEKSFHEIIDEIINEPIKIKSKKEAYRDLRKAGILDSHNNLKPAYKDVFYIGKKN